ncbi:MAG: hypothetical protein ACT4RN_08835 [Pseudonocardia sp.]
MVAWGLLLVGTALRGWRLLVVALVLGGVSWLATSSIVNTGTGAGWFLDVPAHLLNRPNAVLLAVLPGFVLLTADLVPRALGSGRAGYAATRLGSRGRWWAGTAVGVAILAAAYTAAVVLAALAAGLVRLGVRPGPQEVRAAMLAEVGLPAWLTEPSAAAAGAILLPLFGALVALGLLAAVVSLWAASPVAPGLAVAAVLVASLLGVNRIGRPPALDIIAGVSPIAYRDVVRPDGLVIAGASLTLAVAAAAAWVAVLAAAGWWRVRRSGVPVR